MKKNSESVCAVACFLLLALLVAAFSYTATDLFAIFNDSAANAYSALPWK